MPEYTVEEERLLEDALAKEMMYEVEEGIKRSLKSYIGQPTQVLQDVLLDPTSGVLSTIGSAAHISLTNSNVHKTPEIREVPIEMVPLYMNDEDLRTRVTARWRLKISK